MLARMQFILWITIVTLWIVLTAGQEETNCGDVFVQAQSLSGSFSSPNYPRNYGNRMECTWGFRPEPGYSVTIEFEEFDLEGGSTCTFDSVKIENKRYCGTTAPDIVISPINIDVVFKSDQSVTRSGFFARYSFVLGDASCGHPGVPLNGNKTGDTYTYRSVVTFACRDGYDLIGASRITCQSNGEWSADRPTCRERITTCGDPGTPQNGAKTGSTYTVYSVVTFDCNEGYDVSGSSRIICEANGLWSDNRPRCVPSCGAVISQSETVSGTFTSPGYPGDYGNNRGCTWVFKPFRGYQVYIQFRDFDLEDHRSCNYDYLQIRSNRYCGTTRPDPVTLPEGVNIILRSDYSFSRRGFSAEYSFVLGPPGPPVEPPPPQPPTPGPPQPPDPTPGPPPTGCVDLNVICPQFAASCQSDQVVIDNCPLTCGRCPGGTSCPNLPDLSDGQVFRTNNNVGSTIQFQCNSGYQLQGSPSLTCMPSGQWSGGIPSCQRISSIPCPNLPDLANGQVYRGGNNVGSTIQFQCNSGFQLQGEFSLTCMSSGQWSGSMPSCQRISSIPCPNLPDLANGQVYRGGNDVGSTIQFQCNSGFQLQGEFSLTCMSSGQWSGSMPTCQSTSGPAPATPPPGGCVDREAECPNFADWCDSDDVVLNACPRTCGTCGGDGRSTVLCPSHADLPNGQVYRTDNNVGSTVQFQCVTGFQLQGPSMRTCMSSGRWSGDMPVCEGLQTTSCPDLPDLLNGRVDRRGNTIGSTIQFQCNSEYFLQGQFSLTCLSSGQWSDTMPICQRQTDVQPVPPPTPSQDRCSLPSDSGPCRASIMRYYYDASAFTCRTFTYGGCAGNDNNFNTMEECIRACSVDTNTGTGNGGCRDTEDICPDYLSYCQTDVEVARACPVTCGTCQVSRRKRDVHETREKENVENRFLVESAEPVK